MHTHANMRRVFLYSHVLNMYVCALHTYKHTRTNMFLHIQIIKKLLERQGRMGIKLKLAIVKI